MRFPSRMSLLVIIAALLLEVTDTHSLSLQPCMNSPPRLSPVLLDSAATGSSRRSTFFRSLSRLLNTFRSTSSPAPGGMSGCMSANNVMTQKVLFVVGGPGSGKGTLCKQLSQLGHIHISAGSLLRAHISAHGSGSTLQEEVEEVRRVVDSGGLVRSNVMVRLLKRELARHMESQSSPVEPGTAPLQQYFLLDGFPRNWDNHVEWQRQMQGEALEVAGCVLLECSPEVMTRRCLAREKAARDREGDEDGEVRRTDDRLDVIERRLQTYRSNMGRVSAFFGAANKLLRVNGDLPKEEVFETVKLEMSKLTDGA